MDLYLSKNPISGLAIMGCTLCKYFNLQVKQLLSSAPSTFTNRFSSKKPIWLEIYALLCEKLFSGYFIPFIFICSCYILSRYKYIIITQEHMKQHGRWHLHVSMCSDQLGILKPCGVCYWPVYPLKTLIFHVRRSHIQSLLCTTFTLKFGLLSYY